MSDASEQHGEPAFNIAPVVLLLIIFMLAIHAARMFLFTPEQDNYIIAYGAFIPLAYQGEVGMPTWSLITSPVSYALLHGSWAHVGINSLWLAVFGAPLAARIGPSRFLAFFVVTAVAAALLHFTLHHDSINPLIGASGAVSGFTAAAARFGFAVRRSDGPGFSGQRLTLFETLTNRTSVSFILIWFAINFLPAISDFGGGNIAWQAHIGGFITGLLLLPFFDISASPKP
jgi:membrane associated rhomboid family serine protease